MSNQPTKKRKKSETKQSRKEKERHLWIKWNKKSNLARHILLDDLQFGRLSMNAVETSADEAWDFYRKMPEFEKICFSQFEERLADHRKQVGKQWRLCKAEEAAFRKDQARGFRNTRTHNHRGELIIDLDPVKDLIRQDVNDNMHEGISMPEFQATRPEYLKIDKTKFKEKVYHEIKRKKFIYGWDKKRLEKGRKKPALYKEVKKEMEIWSIC